MKNQFKKPCHYCREMVMPGEGNLWKFGTTWYVAHPECSEKAMKKAKKEDIRIEFPSKGATYYNESYGVYKYDVWSNHSVLAGQERRTYLKEFDSLEEAKAEFPDAEVIDHSCFKPLVMSSVAPDWFDPLDAGEEW